MKLLSPVFNNEEMIPKKYTCLGEDINPPLKIEDLPPETKTLALVVEDPDAPSGLFVHWVVYNIPITEKIKENSIPGLQGQNDFQRNSWGGPCPPSGSHRYFFKLFALDSVLDLKEGISKETLIDAMTGHIIVQTELMGYVRKDS